MSQESNVLSQEFAELLKDNQDPKKYFTKKKYESYFEDYCHLQEPLFQKISLSYETAEDKDALLKQLAQAIAIQGKKDIDSCKGLKKENRKGELNLYMVTSIFPCILKLGGDYATPLCDQIVLAWKESFPGTELGYANYESLSTSFRSFWGFLTGR